MKILIADDSTATRNLIADILRQQGFTDLIHAVDGIETMAAINGAGIGLALLDWHMPIMSGYEVLRRMRAEGRKIPVIMVTGDSAAEHVNAALRAGVDQFLAKPFKAEDLIEKVYHAASVRHTDQFEWPASFMTSLAKQHPSCEATHVSR